jgi:hypothetical protein
MTLVACRLFGWRRFGLAAVAARPDGTLFGPSRAGDYPICDTTIRKRTFFVAIEMGDGRSRELLALMAQITGLFSGLAEARESLHGRQWRRIDYLVQISLFRMHSASCLISLSAAFVEVRGVDAVLRRKLAPAIDTLPC